MHELRIRSNGICGLETGVAHAEDCDGPVLVLSAVGRQVFVSLDEGSAVGRNLIPTRGNVGRVQALRDDGAATLQRAFFAAVRHLDV